MIGSTISHYKILEKLGEGGMGVVYKAQDTKLNRTVALKFLPDRVNQDPAAKERFLQEAQAAAGLNHSNICTIHGVEEHEGTLFIVMEYIDGGTLREKLPYAKVDDALRVAVQIGEALQEAHAKNIVHRDIKADNIMLTSKDQAKVMDFGLAKLKGALKLTRSSSTVGTLAYMAPEQIQGGEVDTRSDIFSFGVLMFEMLTGKTPFRGEHEAAMMYSILNEEPEPLQKYLPDPSPDLLHMLNRVLEKDPTDRYQSVADMVSELRRLLKQSSRITKRLPPEALIPPTPQTSGEEPQKGRKPSKTRHWTLVSGIGILVLAALLYALFFTESGTLGSKLNPDMTLRVLPIPFSQFSYPGLSKDGNWIAFPAADVNNKWDIYYMHVSGSNVRRLTTDSTSTGGDLNADISPDGSQVVYSTYGKAGQMMIGLVSSVGGPSKILAEDALLPRWRPDGQRIGFIRFEPGSKVPYRFWSMKPDGSDQRLEYADTLMAAFRFSFNWSPDGNSLAWIRSASDGSQEIFTHELQSGKELQLTSDRKNADDVAWTRNGYIIYSSNRGGNTNLWMTPVTGGTSIQLTKGGGPDIGISVSADDQRLVYLQQQRIGRIWNTDLSSFSSKQLTFDDRVIGSVALSPDGNKIAFSMGEIDPIKPASHLFIQDRGGADRRQVTTADGFAYNPAWSPDGKWVSFTRLPLNVPSDSAKIFFVDAFNPGTPKFVAEGFRSFWLSSDRLVVRKSTTTNGNAVISDELVLLDGGSQGKFLGDSLIAIGRAAGNMVVYADLHQKAGGTWIAPVDYAASPSRFKPRRLPSIQGNVLARSMRFAYYVTSRNELWRVEYSTGKQERLQVSPPGLDMQSQGSVSYDDKNLIYVTYQLSGKLVMMENIFK